MFGAIKAMFGSKKFLASVVGMVVGLVAKVGIELDTDAVMAVLSPVLAFVLGQGIADAGKEAKKAANGSS